jgi:hypothetical protein
MASIFIITAMVRKIPKDYIKMIIKKEFGNRGMKMVKSGTKYYIKMIKKRESGNLGMKMEI